MKSIKTNVVFVNTEFNDIPKIISNTTISVNVWFSGCHGECKNCHNPELQIPCPGYTIEEIQKELTQRRSLCEWVVFTGGDPLMNYNIKTLKEICKIANVLNYKIMIYTGYEFEEIQHEIFDINMNYIKCGKYDDTQTNEDYIFGSTNQYLIDTKTNTKKYFYENDKIIINT